MSDAAVVLCREDRKRLGQYFTGEPLARVLAALADVQTCSAVIDPMAGSGDMLEAARQVGGASDLTAIEIDPVAAERCRARFASPIDLRVANAFDTTTWASDIDRAWDVVITNPPYVRYQRSSRSATGPVHLPSATKIRTGLLGVIDDRRALSSNERAVLRSVAEGYSGLADLAVPSWLLCAALVAPGGRLAMLVPDTWLSRDYALPVLYVLRRFFALEYVVEDGEASWFDDALVRTTLVVARRVSARSSGLFTNSNRHVHARLTPAAADDRSLIGALHPRAQSPELRFRERLRGVANSTETEEWPGLSAEAVDDAQARDRLRSQLPRTTWGRSIEATATQPSGAAYLPRRLRDIVRRREPELCTLEDLGWSVGQGLRTGANRFFYSEFVEGDDRASRVAVDDELSSNPISVPNDLLRVVVRRQRDVAAAAGVAHRSPGRLLHLVEHALPEDIAAAEAVGVAAPYVPLQPTVSEHVRRAAVLNVGSDAEPRHIPELSAVVTNGRRANPTKPSRAPRFWYQLPPLAPRHTGNLFVARVCYRHPEVFGNPRSNVIDANFSTLWRHEDKPGIPGAALLALLRSSWAVLTMELTGTVLGGGALKIEATQLRRLPLPAAAMTISADLEHLGQAAYNQAGPLNQEEVDRLIWSVLDVGRAGAKKIALLAEKVLRCRTPRQTPSDEAA